MEGQFGKKIRFLRDKLHLQRRQQITVIAEILKYSRYEVITLRLTDQIYSVIKGETLAKEAMHAAEEKSNSKILNQCWR